ncbi:HAMP domain-containing sensor histidine kinase [Paenibacillus odorifer]|uniref:sensor histidine kinase n=1 Tax=Paenibacillus TaxID=44249 RepID=UPI00096D52BD|nr:HAMP domain-containing sensor histidine kinase [Paenibacillus odorifer]OME23905.1 two-component sensor histidine kinase [Paenibacillus odorifer]OME33543.1 two-component sensor histidine kinase [Paenibacillus odorifer]OME39668.1 two-component sensor histidine kinase [Paenibacillus odorifer]
MSIRLRLTAWYSGILAVMLLALSAAIYGFVYFNTYGDLKNRLQVQAEQTIPFFSINLYSGELMMDGVRTPENSNTYTQIYVYDTKVMQRTTNMRNGNLAFDYPERDKIVQGFRNVVIEGNQFLIYERPILLENYKKNPAAVLQVATYVGEQNKLLERLKTILLVGSFATLIAAFTFGLFLARKSMSPIGKVIEAANGIQTGNDLSSRIEYDGPPDEIGRLIETVNSMLGRMEGFYTELEDSYAAQRRFVSDASHELRTPLTTIRGNIDLLQKVWEMEPGEGKMSEAEIRQLSLESVQDIADESKRMSRLVADMLSLARADTGRTFDIEPVALEPMMNEIARRASFLPRQAEWVTGDMSVLNGKYIVGNKDYLQQMLFIFIDNAFKYTPSGIVSLDTLFYQNQVGIRITDTGIGMDKDEVPYIFDRFYRADESRGITEGIGLGLSIAKWIIDEHGGSVEVVTRQGEGTTFVIWLPLLFAPPLE